MWSSAHFTRGSGAGRGGVPRLPRYPGGRGGEHPHTEEPWSQEQGTIYTHRLNGYINFCLTISLSSIWFYIV